MSDYNAVIDACIIYRSQWLQKSVNLYGLYHKVGSDLKQTYAIHFHSDNQVREDLNVRLEKEGRVKRENWSINHYFGRVEVIDYKQRALDLRERRH